jgi:SAM-dependent methyltransferase
MIARGQQLAHEAHVSVNFIIGAVERARFDYSFDGAICLFTTLGQISEQDDNVALLQTVYTALKSGGRLMIEVPQRDTAVANLKAHDEFGSGDHKTVIKRAFDAETQIVTEQFKIIDGESMHHFLLQYRLFSEEKLTQLLTEAGFKRLARFADYHGAPLQTDSGMMILVGEK